MARWRSGCIAVLIFTFAATLFCAAQKKSDTPITVVFKDGHQKAFADVSKIDFQGSKMVINYGGRQESISLADVMRMEVNATKLPPLGRNHFIGKWEFGQGGGTDATFYVTLYANGQADKSIGAPHGTWVLVDGEARISWDDGWHDVIRKVGEKHEKFAYEPGRSIDDEPSNVAMAKSLNGQTM